jgi:flavin reductase (DIM6/NTAB) family NADH-FMN oxidoreductase RutF
MVQADKYRSVTGSFATGVTVTTLPGDPPHGLTANAFCSVSMEPPLVQVCVSTDTTSYELLENQGVDRYCVNILASDQRHLGEHFANMNEMSESPFNVESTSLSESGVPVFEESLAYIDCEVWDSIPAGDHVFYVGEVQEMDVLNPDKKGLTFFKGDWGEIQ